jgi:hypothetical protein
MILEFLGNKNKIDKKMPLHKCKNKNRRNAFGRIIIKEEG